MRKNVATGILLAIAAGLVVLVGAALDLELESVALLGVSLGAVLALVPDRSPAARLGGFAAGFAVAWVGYVVRAALLPDTSAGRAVAVAVVVLLCALIAAATADRLPLWTLLVGAATLAGAYEYTYAAAPPELMSTSVATATTVFLSLSVGFCVVAILGLPGGTPRRDDTWLTPTEPETAGHHDHDFMEMSK